MTLGPGGAEKLAADLSIGLREKGHRVTVAAWHNPDGSVPTRLRSHGVELVPITFPKPGFLAAGRTVRDVRNVLVGCAPTSCTRTTLGLGRSRLSHAPWHGSAGCRSSRPTMA